MLNISKPQTISLDIKLHQTLNQRKQRKKDCEFLFIDYFINLPSHLYLKSLTNPSLMVCVHNFINSTCMPMRTFKEYIFYPGEKKKKLQAHSSYGANFCKLSFRQFSGNSFPMIKCCRVQGQVYWLLKNKNQIVCFLY